MTYKEVIDVIQTGKAPGGADVAELSEIVGMEAAIKLVNRTIPYPITEDHIMNLHRRILGPVDPDNAGQYRIGCRVGSLAPSCGRLSKYVGIQKIEMAQFMLEVLFLQVQKMFRY